MARRWTLRPTGTPIVDLQSMGPAHGQPPRGLIKFQIGGQPVSFDVGRLMLVPVVGIAFCGSACTHQDTQQTPVINSVASEQVEAFLAGSEIGPVIAAMKRYYPREADGYIRNIAAALAQSGGNTRRLSELGEQAMLQFLRDKWDDVANAPDDHLLSMTRATLALLRRASATDVAFCASLSGGPAVDPRLISPENRHLMLEHTAQLIQAAGEGHSRPRDPSRTQLSEQVRAAYAAAIRRRDPGGEVLRLLRDGAAMNSASLATKCRVGVVLHEAMMSLAPAQGARVIAFNMNEAAAVARELEGH